MQKFQENLRNHETLSERALQGLQRIEGYHRFA